MSYEQSIMFDEYVPDEAPSQENTIESGQGAVQIVEPRAFDYSILPADKRMFVFQKADETRWLLKMTSENMIKIGQNLRAVKATLPHGQFTPWIASELGGMTNRTAQRFMIAADFAAKHKTDNLSVFSPSALYLLAADTTPEEAVNEALKLAEEGQQVTHAMAQKLLEAQKAKEQAERESAEAKAQIALVQTSFEDQLTQTQRNAVERVRQLMEEIAKLQKPDEVIVVQWPEDKAQELAILQAKADRLNELLEAEKRAIPPEVQQQLKNLQEELDRIRQDREAQQKRIEALDKDVKDALEKRELLDAAENTRKKWRLITSDVRSCMMRFLGQFPTPVAVRSFEPNDWLTLNDLKETLRRVLNECETLHAAPVATKPFTLMSLRDQPEDEQTEDEEGSEGEG